MMSARSRYAMLRASGTALIVDVGAPVPVVLHWGADLGELPESELDALRASSIVGPVANSPDSPREFTLLPVERDMWSGVPGLEGHRGGVATTPRPKLVDCSVEVADSGVGGVVRSILYEPIADLELELRLELESAGILSVGWSVTAGASAAQPYDLAQLNAMVPLPARAAELLDFSGRWSRERAPQRRLISDGIHLREIRRGKPGVDSPFLMVAGTPGFGNRRGEVWAAHVAWSGDQRSFVQRLPEGAGALAAVLGGGELLRPGEVRLAPGERYDAPAVLFAWSGEGLDGVADRFHARLRHRRPRQRPQPVVLNTWEAVYFDHDMARLGELIDRSAQIGVERVVLDDGWFRGRRDDSAGLGDWQVDEHVWPDGLDPLVARVHEAGMEFGLWFEPEMVNLDSDLAREHPEWLLAPSAGVAGSARRQYALNIADPGAHAYLLESISDLVARHDIRFIKWDHNRELHEAVVRGPGGDRPGVHMQTLAFYELLDELRERHPELEVESCASGGGRVDLGVLDHTDRVWTSDCNDPIERQSIQRWTELLLTPELIGSHVGAGRSHTTHRMADLSFRLATAAFASPGIEWDITTCTEDELAQLARWVAFLKEWRGLLHGGVRVHADLADEQTLLHGTVAADGSRALFSWVRLATSDGPQLARTPFAGLDGARDYVVRVVDAFGSVAVHGSDPEWMSQARGPEGGFRVSGALLAGAGLPLPMLQPEAAMVFEFIAVD
jgi:alpha-galactosidase